MSKSNSFKNYLKKLLISLIHPKNKRLINQLPDEMLGLGLLFIRAFAEEYLKQLIQSETELIEKAKNTMTKEQFQSFLIEAEKFYQYALKIDQFIQSILVEGFLLYKKIKK